MMAKGFHFWIMPNFFGFCWINAARKSFQDVYSGKLAYFRVFSAIFVYSTNFRDIWIPCGVNWCIDLNSRCMILQAKIH